MYRQFEVSWLKHIDFLLVDLLSLSISFGASYWLLLAGQFSHMPDFYRAPADFAADYETAAWLFLMKPTTTF